MSRFESALVLSFVGTVLLSVSALAEETRPLSGERFKTVCWVAADSLGQSCRADREDCEQDVRLARVACNRFAAKSTFKAAPSAFSKCISSRSSSIGAQGISEAISACSKVASGDGTKDAVVDCMDQLDRTNEQLAKLRNTTSSSQQAIKRLNEQLQAISAVTTGAKPPMSKTTQPSRPGEDALAQCRAALVLSDELLVSLKMDQLRVEKTKTLKEPARDRDFQPARVGVGGVLAK